MSIRDRIAYALAYADPAWPGDTAIEGIPWMRHYADAAAILAACPEIAALDHAREGWLTQSIDGRWSVYPDRAYREQPAVLVIPVDMEQANHG